MFEGELEVVCWPESLANFPLFTAYPKTPLFRVIDDAKRVKSNPRFPNLQMVVFRKGEEPFRVEENG